MLEMDVNTESVALDTPNPETTASDNPKDLKDLVEKGYNTVAPAYLAWSAPRPTTTRLKYLNKLIECLPPNGVVIELGCGAGVPCTQMLAQSECNLKITGVDISEAQVALAREHVGPKAEFLHADMMDVSFEPGSCDAVIAFYSIFHLPREEQGELLRRIVNWLRPGGRLLFNLATEEGNQFIDDWMGVRMFHTGFGVEGNREMVRQYGVGLEVEDEVAGEKVGSGEVLFHWVWAIKKSNTV